MRLLSLLLAAALAVSAAEKIQPADTATPINPMLIQGVWKGYQSLVKDSVAFAFYSKNRGRSFTKGQIVSSFLYDVDFTKKPIPLEMKQKEGRSRAIIQFVGRDTMFLKMARDSAAITEFSPGFDSAACLLIRVPMPGQDSALGK